MRSLATGIVLALFVSACGDEAVAPLFDVQDVNVTVMEDTPVSVIVPVAANHAVTAMITGQPTHGTITSTPDNRMFTYTPALNYNGPDAVSVTFTSGTDSKVGTAHITVTPVDDAPVANPDNFAAAFQTPTTFAQSALLANDTDVDSTVLTVTAATGVTHCQVALQGTDVLFTPEAAYQGIATFAYTVSDGTLTAVGQVTVTIGNNSPPVAVADTVAGTEDTTLTIMNATLLANDTDADHQTLTIVGVSNGTFGTVSLVPGGVTFVPSVHYHGAAGFNYTITDGLDTASAAVTINLSAISHAPVTAPDAVVTNEDTPLTVPFATLLSNDVDVDGATLTISAVGNATNGTVALGTGNTVVFTPALHYRGQASFDYTASNGTLTAPGHVTVTVTPVYHPPVAVDDNISGAENTVITVATTTLLANDTDIDGATLSFVGVGNPSNGTVAASAGTVSYTPSTNFRGAATFTYTITDGQTNANGTVHVNVTPVNHPPVAVNDAIATVEHVDGSVNALANDSDIDGDTLTIQSVTQGMNGTVTFAGAIVTYHPGVSFNGQDSFTYTISDGNGGTATATISVIVANSNDPPVTAGDSVVTNEDTAVAFNPTSNDVDPNGNPLSLASFGQPVHGIATAVGNIVTYTPAKDYNGPDAMVYAVSDTTGGMSSGSISITVIPVDDAPVANGESYTVDEDTALVVSAANGVLTNDTDIDSPVLNAILVTTAANGTLVLNSDGSFFYQGAPNYNGPDSFTYRAFDGTLVSNPVTVQITVNSVNDAPVAVDDVYDTGANQEFNTSCGDIIKANGKVAQHAPVNHSAANTGTAAAPIVGKTKLAINAFSPKKAAATKNIFFTCGVLANDSDVEDVPLTQTVNLLTAPSHGSFDESGLTINGDFDYTPDDNFSGVDTFTYAVTDSNGADSNIATVKIIVHPIARDDFFESDSGANVITGEGLGSGGPDIGNANNNMVAVLDMDGDPNTTEAGGSITLNPDGSFSYEQPDSDEFFGEDGDCFFTPDNPTIAVTRAPVVGASVATGSALTIDATGAVTVTITGSARTRGVGSTRQVSRALHQPPGGDGPQCFESCTDRFYYYDDSGGGATSLTTSTWGGSGNGDGKNAGDNTAQIQAYFGVDISFCNEEEGFITHPQDNAAAAAQIDLDSD